MLCCYAVTKSNIGLHNVTKFGDVKLGTSDGESFTKGNLISNGQKVGENVSSKITDQQYCSGFMTLLRTSPEPHGIYVTVALNKTNKHFSLTYLSKSLSVDHSN